MSQYDNLDDFMKHAEPFDSDFGKQPDPAGTAGGSESGSFGGRDMTGGGLRMKDDGESGSGLRMKDDSAPSGGLRMKEDTDRPSGGLRMKADPEEAVPGAQAPGGYVDMSQYGQRPQGPQGSYGGPGPQGNYPGGPAGGGYGGPNGPGGYGPGGNAAYGAGGYVSPGKDSGIGKYIVGAIIVIALIAIVSVALKMYKNKFIPGELSGHTYKNAYFGIQADVPSDWQISGYNGDADKEKKDLALGKTVTEVTASRETTSSISMFNVLVVNGRINREAMDMSAIMTKYSAEVKAELEGMGFSDVQVEQTKMMVAGKNCDAYKVSARITAGNASMSLVVMQAYMVRGKYVAAITSGGLTEADAKKALEQIKAYAGE
ncbi:MAG: hypothetical protein IJ619_10800 [Eubacterium sp.]|nr:hypothetical protein [Eubacterium sp.]